jgi:hypothetical protein
MSTNYLDCPKFIDENSWCPYCSNEQCNLCCDVDCNHDVTERHQLRDIPTMSSKPLKSLAEHNNQVIALLEKEKLKKYANGIACPQCSKELLDKSDQLTAGQTVIGTYCSSCTWTGMRRIHPSEIK